MYLDPYGGLGKTNKPRIRPDTNYGHSFSVGMTVRCSLLLLPITLYSQKSELDSQEFSSMAQDANKSRQFRSETVAYIEASLSGASEHKLSQISANPIIVSFNRIAQAVRLRYNTSMLFAHTPPYIKYGLSSNRPSMQAS